MSHWRQGKWKIYEYLLDCSKRLPIYGNISIDIQVCNVFEMHQRKRYTFKCKQFQIYRILNFIIRILGVQLLMSVLIMMCNFKNIEQ